MTVGQQIGEGVRLHLKLGRLEARQRVIDLLKTVGIAKPETRLNDYPHQFSGGMRQRVMIALALACGPKLLIADEPTTALDVTIQAQIINLILELQRKLGMAIIWISHDLAVVARIAKRVLVMYAGQIVESAPTELLFEAPRHPYTIGLLKSLPRIDKPRLPRLRSIEGLPPRLAAYPDGCPFAPRCSFALESCQSEPPPTRAVGAGHTTACILDSFPDQAVEPS
jgi:oligopeptide transport system ATP-binding protein